MMRRITLAATALCAVMMCAVAPAQGVDDNRTTSGMQDTFKQSDTATTGTTFYVRRVDRTEFNNWNDKDKTNWFSSTQLSAGDQWVLNDLMLRLPGTHADVVREAISHQAGQYLDMSSTRTSMMRVGTPQSGNQPNEMMEPRALNDFDAFKKLTEGLDNSERMVMHRLWEDLTWREADLLLNIVRMANGVDEASMSYHRTMMRRYGYWK